MDRRACGKAAMWLNHRPVVPPSRMDDAVSVLKVGLLLRSSQLFNEMLFYPHRKHFTTRPTYTCGFTSHCECLFKAILSNVRLR